MLQTLEVHKLLSGNIFKTNLFFENSMVFIERPDFFTKPDQQSGYISIQRFNYITQDFYKFQFSKPVDLITYTSCHSVIYYAYINNEKGNYCINLNKVNCINWNDENILTIDMEVSEDNESYGYNLENSIITGLSERYVLLAIPKENYEFGTPFFHKVFLIDSFENKAYLIPDTIKKLDTLLRIDDINILNNGEYVMFKTGRIRPFEKRKIWNNQKEKGIFAEYPDHLETLIVCKLDEFVNNTKCELEIPENNLIQRCDMNSCLSVIGTDNDKIIYLTQYFKENVTEVVFFNFKLNQTEIIKIKEVFNHIAYFNGKLYGVLNNEKCIEIYDINKKQKIFTTNTDEGIIYIDDENIVTCKCISGEFKNLFTVNNLISGNITTFKSRFSEFVCEKNMLVLF